MISVRPLQELRLTVQLDVLIRTEIRGEITVTSYRRFLAVARFDGDAMATTWWNQWRQLSNEAGNAIYDLIGCPDNDQDGWSNSGDAFPDRRSQYRDTDDDGYGDNNSPGAELRTTGQMTLKIQQKYCLSATLQNSRSIWPQTQV